MAEFTHNKVNKQYFLLTILFVFLGVKIPQNKQNAQNAHLVDNMSSREQKGDRNIMSKKLTGEQYRRLVNSIGKDKADEMATVLGVATQRVGKMNYAPQPIVEAWDMFLAVVGTYLDDWNDDLPEGVEKIRKVDLNIKK